MLRRIDEIAVTNNPTANTPSSRFHLIPWLLALTLVGAVFFLTDPRFTIIDDEVNVLIPAMQPVSQLLRAYWVGAAPHPHPPLFDVILNGWLRITHGNLRLLRLPAVTFYLAGIWFLALAADRLAGPRARKTLMLMGLLWPYGFHFGRLAVWYSCSFFLVALVTYEYLLLLEQQTVRRWALLGLAACALLYSNYFGWLMLACLLLDFLLNHREKALKHWPLVLGAFLLLFLAYFPLWRSFLIQARSGPKLPESPAGALLYAGLAGYVLFVSESAAPWFWWLGAPATLAICVSLVIVLRFGPGRSRRFLLYFSFAFVVMVIMGILTTKRIMLIAPWLLLALGTTLAAVDSRFLRRALFLSFVLEFGIGWFGIFSRHYYAAPRFLEPWPQVAADAARKAERGAVVIGNHPSFLLYLTAALQESTGSRSPHLNGVLTYSAFRPLIYQPDQWVAANRPLRPLVITVQGVPFLPGSGEMEKVQAQLAERCQLTEQRLYVRDRGYPWKNRYRPDLGQSAWRIEVRNYSCPLVGPGTLAISPVVSGRFGTRGS